SFLGKFCLIKRRTSTRSCTSRWLNSVWIVRSTTSRTASMVRHTTRNTTRVTQAVSRKRSVWTMALSRPKSIPASPDGVNQGLPGPPLQLAAQAIDVHFNDVGGPFPIRFPQAFAEHLARDDLPGVTHEQLEDAELRWGEIDF